MLEICDINLGCPSCRLCGPKEDLSSRECVRSGSPRSSIVGEMMLGMSFEMLLVEQDVLIDEILADAKMIAVRQLHEKLQIGLYDAVLHVENKLRKMDHHPVGREYLDKRLNGAVAQ